MMCNNRTYADKCAKTQCLGKIDSDQMFHVENVVHSATKQGYKCFSTIYVTYPSSYKINKHAHINYMED